eukprot:CAMPEP_0198549674 /NCGR_PEP_ID=MMETSP1462-20131121/73246_1 /TAXON_ID=1333877 /ORGANISM="Brandtodinium nutriculum, Strain RCC3387" /LENGTH=81 /DNA_ID=CAMNT_0044280257 /DNA_START=42 /DNA_END=283 /DNA_ORIENTATION=+
MESLSQAMFDASPYVHPARRVTYQQLRRWLEEAVKSKTVRCALDGDAGAGDGGGDGSGGRPLELYVYTRHCEQRAAWIEGS